MTITIRELLNAFDSGAVSRLMKLPVPASGAWKIRRLARLLQAEFQDAQTARFGLFTEQNSVPVTGQDGVRQIKPQCLNAYHSDPLFSRSIELKADPIAIEDFGSASVSVEDLELLGPLVV